MSEVNEKTEALLLADELDAWDGILKMPIGRRARTSAKLRLQHAEIQRLTAERDAAVKCLSFVARHVWDERTSDRAARSIIAHHPRIQAELDSAK